MKDEQAKKRAWMVVGAGALALVGLAFVFFSGPTAGPMPDGQGPAAAARTISPESAAESFAAAEPAGLGSSAFSQAGVLPRQEPARLPVTVDLGAKEVNPWHRMPPAMKRRKAELLALEKALNAYAERYGDYPQGNSGRITRELVAKGILQWPPDRTDGNGDLMDPTDVPYSIETAPGRLFAIVSAGPDKAFDTKDDVVFQNFEALP